ncbi:MAG: YIP1 family protein [Nitrospinae bacterium]|nr:YIP1 family protein [Nitrospinota bacterium]
MSDEEIIEEPQQPEESSNHEKKAEPSHELYSETEEEKTEYPKEVYPEFERDGSNKFKSFFEAVTTILMSPGLFFGKLSLDNGLAYPLIFGIIIYFINSIGGSAVHLFEFILILLTDPTSSSSASLISALVTPLITVFLAPVTLLVSAIIYHLIFKLFKYDFNGFEATVRLVCYSSAPLIIGILPFCGSFIGFIWSAIAMVVGMQIVCRMTTGWAILIYLIPVIFVCSCFALVAAVGGLAFFMTIFPSLEQFQDVLLQEV